MMSSSRGNSNSRSTRSIMSLSAAALVVVLSTALSSVEAFSVAPRPGAQQQRQNFRTAAASVPSFAAGPSTGWTNNNNDRQRKSAAPAFGPLRMSDPFKFGGGGDAGVKKDDSPATTTSSSSGISADFSLDKLTDKVKGYWDSLDTSSITSNFSLSNMKENVMDEQYEFGTRGEVFFATQLALFVFIVIGDVPIFGIGNLLNFLFGPGLFLAGVTTIIASISELAQTSNLSPWITPAKSSTGIKTDGLYSYMRHPLYAGLIAASAGFSVLTGSAGRLILTSFLLYLFNMKTDDEEEALVKKYPNGEYEAYREQVPGKFFPQEILNQLPFGKNATETEGVAEGAAVPAGSGVVSSTPPVIEVNKS